MHKSVYEGDINKGGKHVFRHDVTIKGKIGYKSTEVTGSGSVRAEGIEIEAHLKARKAYISGDVEGYIDAGKIRVIGDTIPNSVITGHDITFKGSVNPKGKYNITKEGKGNISIYVEANFDHSDKLESLPNIIVGTVRFEGKEIGGAVSVSVKNAAAYNLVFGNNVKKIADKAIFSMGSVQNIYNRSHSITGKDINTVGLDKVKGRILDSSALTAIEEAAEKISKIGKHEKKEYLATLEFGKPLAAKAKSIAA